MPPPTGARDHLKIEKDGRLINRATAPDLPEKAGLQVLLWLIIKKKKILLCKKNFKIRNIGPIHQKG